MVLSAAEWRVVSVAGDHLDSLVEGSVSACEEDDDFRQRYYHFAQLAREPW